MNKRMISNCLAIALVGFSMPMIAAAQVPPSAAGPQLNPTPGCKVTPAELEANRKAAMAFFKTLGMNRVALADPSYIQHNPVFKKRAQQSGDSDFETFRKAFAPPPPNQAPVATPAPAAAPTPQPPVGNDFEIVTAECDIVTIVRKIYRQDPTEPSGTFYASYFFDSFRVKNGKLVEHWDAALINPPAPAAR
jgi:predicted SnoaL-like aldol condensation-catalyzing enzyme